MGSEHTNETADANGRNGQEPIKVGINIMLSLFAWNTSGMLWKSLQSQGVEGLHNSTPVPTAWKKRNVWMDE